MDCGEMGADIHLTAGPALAAPVALLAAALTCTWPATPPTPRAAGPLGSAGRAPGCCSSRAGHGMFEARLRASCLSLKGWCSTATVAPHAGPFSPAFSPCIPAREVFHASFERLKHVLISAASPTCGVASVAQVQPPACLPTCPALRATPPQMLPADGQLT